MHARYVPDHAPQYPPKTLKHPEERGPSCIEAWPLTMRLIPCPPDHVKRMLARPIPSPDLFHLMPRGMSACIAHARKVHPRSTTYSTHLTHSGFRFLFGVADALVNKRERG